MPSTPKPSTDSKNSNYILLVLSTLVRHRQGTAMCMAGRLLARTQTVERACIGCRRTSSKHWEGASCLCVRSSRLRSLVAATRALAFIVLFAFALRPNCMRYGASGHTQYMAAAIQMQYILIFCYLSLSIAGIFVYRGPSACKSSSRRLLEDVYSFTGM